MKNKLIIILLITTINIYANTNKSEFKKLIAQQNKINDIVLKTELFEAKRKLLQAQNKCQEEGECGVIKVILPADKNLDKTINQNQLTSTKKVNKNNSELIIRQLKIVAIIDNTVYFESYNYGFKTGDSVVDWTIEVVTNTSVNFSKDKKNIILYIDWQSN